VGLARLAAAFELGRRVEQERSSPGQPLSSPGAVYRYLAPSLRGLTRETFVVILLDGRHRPLGVELVSEGTLTSSLVHPREVFAPAIEGRAAAIVLAHNHPSGDPEPSQEDHEVTRRLVRAGQLLGIQVLDHVILGLGAWTSLRESSAGDLFQEGRWRAGEVAGEDPV
jgi:DNA repair protein RadC